MNPVTEAFGRNLHRRMFGNVWRWAGTYRASNKNLGVEHALIVPRLYEALDQTRYWVEHQMFSPDEIGVRYHHALVFIHPFPNGNGRWSRLMADTLVVRLRQRRFTWGRSALHAADETRSAYIAALKAAETHDLRSLLAFACS